MPLETEPTTEQIVIPGKSELVDRSRVHGDIGRSIRFELFGNESFFGELPDSDKLKDHIDKKGRVFVTEDDDYLFVDPEPLEDLKV